ncbi:MAG: hypothetical protein AB7H80_10730 [Candidatus Kapaibacterium sp.]
MISVYSEHDIRPPHCKPNLVPIPTSINFFKEERIEVGGYSHNIPCQAWSRTLVTGSEPIHKPTISSQPRLVLAFVDKVQEVTKDVFAVKEVEEIK